PGDPLEQVRHARGEHVAAALAQIGGELEDEVALRELLEALELIEQGRGERAAARSDLEHLLESRVQALRDLARERAPEERRDLGRGDEIAVAPELPRARAVVAESRRVERELHVARERQPSRARVDL